MLSLQQLYWKYVQVPRWAVLPEDVHSADEQTHKLSASLQIFQPRSIELSLAMSKKRGLKLSTFRQQQPQDKQEPSACLVCISPCLG